MRTLTDPTMEVTHSGLHPLARTSSMHISMEEKVFNELASDGDVSEGIFENTLFDQGIQVGHAWKQAPDQTWACVMEFLQ